MSSSSSSISPSSSMWQRKKRSIIFGGILIMTLGVLLGVFIPKANISQHHDELHPIVDDAQESILAGQEAVNSSLAAALSMANKITLPSSSSSPSNPDATIDNGVPKANVMAGGSQPNSGIAGVLSGLMGSKAVSPSSSSSSTGSLTSPICYPKDGDELAKMVLSQTTCSVIVLTHGSRQPYQIKKTMNVTSPKIVVGNPVDLPILNGTRPATSVFHVKAGGYLDLRSVQVYRCPPQRFDDGTLRVSIGSSVRVDLGGTFIGIEVLFWEQPYSVENWLNEINHPRNRVRTYGGLIFVAGGNLNLIGCQFLRWRPLGVPAFNFINIGLDVLVLAGNAILVGCYNVQAILFASPISVGNMVAVLGGTLTCIGGGLVNTGGAAGQFGAGQNLFVGGGVLVTVGYQNVGGFAAIVRAGFAQFAVGGGVFIHIAHVHPRVWGVGAVFSAGQTHANGGGIYYMIGGVRVTTAVCQYFAGAGANTFLGAGDLMWVGVAVAGTIVSQAQFGAGGTWYNGGGLITLIGCPHFAATVARFRTIAGGEMFLGGGLATYVNMTRYNFRLADVQYGQGSQIFVGQGSVVLVKTRSITRVKWEKKNAGFAAVYVGGTKVKGPQANTNIYVDKNGVTPLINVDQKEADKLAQKDNMHNRRSRHHRLLYHRRQLIDNAAVQIEEEEPTSRIQPKRNSLVMIQSSDETYVGGKVLPHLSSTSNRPSLFDSGDFDRFVNQLIVDQGEVQVTGAEEETRLEQGAISVSGDTDCFICSGDSSSSSSRVEPQMVGEGTCQISNQCNGDTAYEAIESAQKASPHPLDISKPLTNFLALQGNEDTTDLPDLHLFWHELVVYCKSSTSDEETSELFPTPSCIDELTLKQAVQDYLIPLNGYSLSVSSTAIDLAVQHLVNDDLYEATYSHPAFDSDCTQGHKFNVYITSIDDGVKKPLDNAWKDIVADPSGLLSTIVESLEGGASPPCGLTAKRLTGITYPPMAKMTSFQPRDLGLIGASVLVSSDKSITPVYEVVHGQEYKIFLQNFPQTDGPIEVKLFQGLKSTGQVIASSTTTTTNDDGGIIQLKWTVPVQEEEASGRHYLVASAKNLPALFATSQGFSIQSKATPRKYF